ncbi:hypothetical protein [Streptomyces sp. NPDC048720]
MKGLNAVGATVLLTTDYLEEAETLCDEIALLRAGARQRWPERASPGTR